MVHKTGIGSRNQRTVETEVGRRKQLELNNGPDCVTFPPPQMRMGPLHLLHKQVSLVP